ncbi:MAG: UDP-N-acetylmuramoyl-L-alanine--D-glutamate ligase [Patescibacteria group bacterium]
MLLKNLNYQKIALLGFGLDNQALLALLDAASVSAEITICDARTSDAWPKPKLKNLKVKYQLGLSFNKNLDKFDILFRSPGWPMTCPGIRAAKKGGQTEITSPLNLFFALAPTKNIIGVTGTKGKGTTATLIYNILRANGQRVWLGGNIGVAPLSFINKIRPTDYVILELSSFQLEDLKYSPRIAIITNLFKEHLAPADPNNPNFHSSLAAYWQAKLNIARGAQNKYLIANPDLKNRIKTAKLKTQTIYFSPSSLPSKLVGDFNRQNIGAAVAVAKILKIKPAVYAPAIAGFKNLEHRLEFVAKIKGVRYFDNSFSTTPESTVLDLKSFSEPLIQIAGGADKGANFRPLAQTIKRKVKFLILLPGAGTKRIKKELLALKFPLKKLTEINSMEKALIAARARAQVGDVVLLSTACASFGLFKNYKERGNLFKKYVKSEK